MKQCVIRKTLTGDWEAFTFPQKSRFFKVKNRSSGDVFVSFESNTETSECFSVAAGEIETVAISSGALERKDFFVKAIYAIGTGDVEITAIDAYIPQSIDVDGNVLILGDKDNIEGNVAIINSKSEIDGNILIIGG